MILQLRRQIPLCLLVFYVPITVFAQDISWEWLAPTPEPITNQGVSAVQVDDNWYVYSFAGLDATINCTGDHLKVFRYDVQDLLPTAVPAGSYWLQLVTPDGQEGRTLGFVVTR